MQSVQHGVQYATQHNAHHAAYLLTRMRHADRSIFSNIDYCLLHAILNVLCLFGNDWHPPLLKDTRRTRIGMRTS